MLVPFIFIGVGGSGGKTLRVIRSELETRLREVGWDAEFPKAWQFLHIDVPSQADGEDPDLPRQLPRDCYVPLAGFDLDYRTIDATLMQSANFADGQDVLEGLVGWRPRPEDVRVPINRGAGQYRALGRAVALANLEKIRVAIGGAVTQVQDPSVTRDLYAITELFGAGEPSVEPQTPTAVVVSSLAGGSGAGVFLDTCDVLSIVGGAWARQAVGILYAPDIFMDLREGARRGVNPNALATLSELCAAYSNNESPTPSEFAVFGRAGLPPGDLDQRGPRFPFVVGGSNGIVNFAEQNDAYRAMGRTLAAWVLSSRVQDALGAYLHANWAMSAGEMARISSTGLNGEAAMTPLNALGSSAVSLGRDRFALYAAERLARLAVDRLLEGHMEGAPRDTNAEAQIESIAVRYQRQFVAESGLDEVGKERNDIIDALRHGDVDERLRDLRKAVESGLGAAPRPASVFGSALPVRFSEQVGSWHDGNRVEINRRCRDWVAGIQPRILSMTSRYIADLGLPVTVRLAEGLMSEVDEVLADLERERQTYLTWSGKMNERIAAALRGAQESDNLGPDHPLVERAIEAGLEATDWTSEAALREVAIALVSDLRDGFLAPLVRALQHAVETLSVAVGGGPVGQVSVVQHWPTAEAIPTRFQPAPNERLVEEVDRFPNHFAEQIRASVITDDPAGAIRLAVSQVIEGRRRDVEETTLIELHGKWNPRTDFVRDRSSGPAAAARIQLAVEPAELLERATRWVRDPQPGNSIAKFVNETMSEYLAQESADPSEHNRRLTNFKTSFSEALATARPLVNISNQALSYTYGMNAPELNVVLTEIPFASGTPAHQAAREALVDHGMMAEADRAFSDRAGPQARIDIFSHLTAPYEPVVFDSLMEPMAADYARARGRIDEFWRWRRSRSLPHFIPLAPQVRRTIVRGWWTALILNQVQQGPEGEFKIYSHESATFVSCPHPLLTGSVFDPWERLPSILESLPLAWMAANAGDRQALEPYRRLRILGRTRRGEERTYDRLNDELEDWITSGRPKGNAPNPRPEYAGDATADWEERRQCVLAYLERQFNGYEDKFSLELSARAEVFFNVPRVWELRDDFVQAFEDLINQLQRYTIVSEID